MHSFLYLKRQAHRIYEILRLQVTNINNEAEFKEYRLDVKQRLNIPYQVGTVKGHKKLPWPIFNCLHLHECWLIIAEARIGYKTNDKT